MVNHLPPKDRDVTMILQNYGLYTHMTVEENICYLFKIRCIPKSEKSTS